VSASVEVRKVSKLYQGSEGKPFWALQDVSLDIRAGEFMCAIGPSGCGKTTLLNMIAGFIEPTRGSITLDGHDIVGPGSDRGVVFQEYALFPWLTARRNIEFGLRQQRVPVNDRKHIVDEFLKLAGLSHAADRYPFELSGGMRQRVAVVRALVTRPRILLMDEPFAAVDAMTRATLQEELLRIWREVGLGIFFITHNIEEAVFLAQRIVVMSPYPGRIKEIVEVDLPHPRERGSSEFGAMYTHVSGAFHREGLAA
jgi:NitT/TauT family transport system ATP-binding protein